jgi:hypothetical protein
MLNDGFHHEGHEGHEVHKVLLKFLDFFLRDLRGFIFLSYWAKGRYGLEL